MTRAIPPISRERSTRSPISPLASSTWFAARLISSLARVAMPSPSLARRVAALALASVSLALCEMWSTLTAICSIAAAVDAIASDDWVAERTSQATDEISRMIQAIDHDSSAAVQGMQRVGPQVALGVDMAGQAGAALRQINEASALALGNISEVASATTEQSQASSSVARNVEQISGMIEESASSVRSANDEVLVLEQLAKELRASVARFRV